MCLLLLVGTSSDLRFLTDWSVDSTSISLGIIIEAVEVLLESRLLSLAALHSSRDVSESLIQALTMTDSV